MQSCQYKDRSHLRRHSEQAEFATDFLVATIRRHNETQCGRINKTDFRHEFLNKRLKEVDNIELHRSIFRMIETQLAAESLLHARQDYPLEVIQPALEPLFKNYPKRKQWSALTFILVVLLGIVVTIGAVVLKKIKQGLANYNIDLSDQTQNAISQLNEPSIGGISAGDE